ncbi:FkbM family methyltransferase [Roseibium sp. MMSF_3544]|uniref:FkbM family methyltransferase n=1 Tax=unclassified Roseibium TaxID=2629323 RepID=UPI00273E0A5B|nr:FkbM family methyltransferase [Roseibium sp. MMSF_3544]
MDTLKLVEKDNENIGFLYYADSTKYLSETLRSIETLRNTHPEIPICLVAPSTLVVEKEIFDHVVRCDDEYPQYPFLRKVISLKKTPFKRTVFLDSDVLVISAIDDLFLALDHYDMAIAHAPIRYSEGGEFAEQPKCYTGYNTGVIAYRSNDDDDAFAFLDLWFETCLEHVERFKNDQASFNIEIYKSDIRVLTLPPEYNFRVEFSHQSKAAKAPVRVVHSHFFSSMPKKRFERDFEHHLLSEKPMSFFRKKGNVSLETDAFPDALKLRSIFNEKKGLRSTFAKAKAFDLVERRLSKENLFMNILDEPWLQSRPIQLVQIGANDGEDDLSASLQNKNWTCFLFEPQPELFLKLTEKYGALHPRVRLYDVAITHDPELSTLFRPANVDYHNHNRSKKASAIASMARDHGHISKMDGNDIEKISVKTMSWSNVKKELDTNIPIVLSIDTEGMELDIIRTLDFESHKILAIRYEERHLFPFEKAECKVFLREVGYRVVEQSFPRDTLAIHPRPFSLF